jgi:drug/metabolite transporter (DMT)-like permease
VATFAELMFPISAIFFDYIINGKILSPIQWIAAIILMLSILKISISGRQS